MNKIINVYGIDYKIPSVHLLHKTPLFVSEFSARTCYNSFDKSDNNSIIELNSILNTEGDISLVKQAKIKSAEQELDKKGSSLLYQLSHVYFHESTLEHVSLNFIIKNISRGVLQELARHRIASYSVQSTRYTINNLINWFNITKKFNLDAEFFIEKIKELDLLITVDPKYNFVEIMNIWNKLSYQQELIGQEKFIELTVANSLIKDFEKAENTDEAFKYLSSKNKRNVGDIIKHIITDNFSVDLGFTINLRSLKNFLHLRLSGAAYWQMQLLAHAIYEQIPENYLNLIIKDNKREQFKNINEKIENGIW